MFQFRINTWFRNISIRKKLNFTIGIMAMLIVVELLTLWGSLHILSGVRAAVQQEGVWSKAQKNAVNTLQQYAYSSDTSNYTHFITFLEINEWDKKAFKELEKEKPNRVIIHEAVVNSGVHPKDASAVIDIFYYFGFISYVEKSLNIFWQADELMLELRDIGTEMHANITQNSKLNSTEISILFDKLGELNKQLSLLEADFSNTMGESARWIDDLVLTLLFAIALTVEISGVLLAMSLSRGISKGINEVIRVSKKVAQGNFDVKAEVYSKDEIGVLANSFNDMINEVHHINKELKQFAYIASHDLQEPLNTIATFNAHLQDPNSDWDEAKKLKARQFISKATIRMQKLIKDLMDFSRVGRNAEMKPVNMQKLMQTVVEQLHDQITEAQAVVSFENLPIINGNKLELIRLFQNLISNAIKFQTKGKQSLVSIHYTDNLEHHEFVVKDNGIGINKDQQERIFEVFQRLHNSNEYPGTGIGLAICRKIISLHKGKLHVVSKEGIGSEFHVSIPKKLM